MKPLTEEQVEMVQQSIRPKEKRIAELTTENLKLKSHNRKIEKAIIEMAGQMESVDDSHLEIIEAIKNER